MPTGTLRLPAVLTVDAERDLGVAAGRTAEIIDAEGDLGFAADDVVARRAHDGELAVAFARRAGQKDVERRAEMEGPGIGRVVDLAVGDHDGAGDAVGRCIGERRVQRGEQRGAAGLGPASVVVRTSASRTSMFSALSWSR